MQGTEFEVLRMGVELVEDRCERISRQGVLNCGTDPDALFILRISVAFKYTRIFDCSYAPSPPLPNARPHFVPLILCTILTSSSRIRHSMETVKEDEIRMEDENELTKVLNMGSFHQGSDNQAVQEELMRLVDIVEETFEGGIENHEKTHESREGTQKHVHLVIQETKNEIRDLTTENKVLQRRLLALQKRRSTIGTKLFLEGAETQYQIALKAWMDAKEELDNVMNDYNNKIDRMQEIVRERQQNANELHKAFSAYKWQVARDARHIMSGKRLSSKLLDELQDKDTEADVDIERLRIEGRQLASQLKKTQLAILKKDQLSDALFAVDYEQLRIENESLNDKLSKKNKELSELGKKTTHIVHVLSHSREKLEFVRKKITGDTGMLQSLESELSKARLEFQHIKIICEKLRSKRERIQTTVNVRTLPLLDDMEAYRDEAKILEKKLRELKHRYDTLVNYIHKMQSKIRQDTPSCFVESQTMQHEHSSTRNLRWGATINIHSRKTLELNQMTTMNVRTLPLLDGMEAYRDEAKILEKKLRELKHRYDTLVNYIHKMQSKIRQDTPSCFVESQTMQPEHSNTRNLR
ncbi:hypothetical protein GOP47_0000932 [Adiantum capillus-veneris]|uniref:CCDC113/CCDC96 coiled-coil domain-containing protein n=1 Tax=Adiantum capillus-veneris TaxID=13818 RepID=A0A9D4VEG3_ADICA|nr:hypothetical protein GOP47_0000932 [Adiantum capillus-veneris]